MFETKKIEFIHLQNDIWITIKSLSTALGVKTNTIRQILKRHKILLESYIKRDILSHLHNGKNITIFNRKGALAIILFSNSPKAIEFQNWVIDTIDQLVFEDKNKLLSNNFEIIELQQNEIKSLKQIDENNTIKMNEIKGICEHSYAVITLLTKILYSHEKRLLIRENIPDKLDRIRHLEEEFFKYKNNFQDDEFNGIRFLLEQLNFFNQ